MKEKKRQQNSVIELKARIESHKTRNKEKLVVSLAKRKEEIEFLKFQVEHLTDFFKQIQEK